jgi:transcriptional regulator NrdR family protein
MRCPKCQSDSSVTETRPVGELLRRRRRCDSNACSHRFTTIEAHADSNTNHKDAVVLVLAKPVARELRSALAHLDRGLGAVDPAPSDPPDDSH